MPTIVKLFSLKEAAQHNTRDDCWVVIDGKVYDVTEYLDEHPGGDDVLISAAGKDATFEFEDAGHSKSARELMKGYCVGEVDPSPVIEELEIFTKQRPSFTQKFMNKTQQLWAIPVAVVGISVVVSLLYLRKK
uniref:Putative cytochrome b5 isoform 2 n=1 Tax=Anthurium amnicola TaxID=1678845 RepID=A0A1D1XKV4_9ARAE